MACHVDAAVDELERNGIPILARSKAEWYAGGARGGAGPTA